MKKIFLLILVLISFTAFSQEKNHKGIYRIDSLHEVLNTSSDTTNLKPIGITSTGKKRRMAYWPGGGVKTLSSQYTDASNTSTTETDLLSYTLPANTLVNNGDRIVIEAVFTTPSNGDNKDLKFYFGASTQDWTSSTIASGVTIKVRITIIKTGSNSQRQIREFYTGFSEIPGYTTSGESEAGSILTKFTGTCAASSDITQRTMTVTYYPN